MAVQRVFDEFDKRGLEAVQLWGNCSVRDAFDDAEDPLADLYPEVSFELANCVYASINDLNSHTKEHELIFPLCREIQGMLVRGGESSPRTGIELGEYRPAFEMYVDGLYCLGHVQRTRHKIDWDDPASLWTEFINVWGKVLVPKGTEPWANAITSARSAPLTLTDSSPDVWHGDEEIKKRVELLLTIARHLQANKPGEAFILSTELVGEAFGKKGETARQFGSRLIDQAIGTGLLTIANEKYSLQARKCRQFRFEERLTALYELNE